MPARRLQAGLWCTALALSVVAGRLIQLQALQGGTYESLAASVRVHKVPIPAIRGSITTADGVPLAMTITEDQVSADPPQIAGATAAATTALRGRVAQWLSGPLHMPAAEIISRLNHPTSHDYVLLAPRVPVTTGKQITALMSAHNVAGIYLAPTYVRSYPNGDLASNLLGFTTTAGDGDITGQAGIEESFNSLLAGRDGEEEEETSTSLQPIPAAAETLRQLVPGRGVRLTIISTLQWEAQQACAQEVRTSGATNCSVVIMRPGTGKILAMAQYPTYQPSHVTSVASTADLPVSEVFPPGSTAKVITAAAAMQNGMSMMAPYWVPYSIDIHGYTVHDAEMHGLEHLTLSGILAESSNVGMSQVVQSVPEQEQYDYYRAFGVGVPTGLPLPGESSGILAPPSQWWGDQRYTLAFGQGVSATAVQMAGVYATIANGGVRVTPSIVAGTTAADGHYQPVPAPSHRRVLTAATAHKLISILQQVPYYDAEAAEPWGEIPGYSIASKTGTAQEGACLCQYGASYIGMAPASNPGVIVAVNVQDPQGGNYFGDEVAGPVFYHVMRFALQTLKIPPDYAKRPHVALTAP